MTSHPRPLRGQVRRGRIATALLLVVIGFVLGLDPLGGVARYLGAGEAQAQPSCGTGGTAVCVTPSSQSANVGASFQVGVAVVNVVNLGAYQFSLTYDPAVVSFVGGANTGFLGSTGRTVSCLGPTATGGRVSMTCVTTSPSLTGPPGPNGPNGSAVLANLNFQGLSAGSSPLTLSNVILATVSATPIPATTINGSVTIIPGPTSTACPGGVCPTATRTPTSTATPTPTGGVTTVRVDPPTQSQPAGATFSVTVVVENVSNLASYQFALAFDPVVLEYSSVTNGTFLGSSGRPVLCLAPIVGTNTVRVGCVTSGASPPGPSGSGVLATVVFRAVSGTFPPTATLLDLFSVELANPAADGISALVVDGTVTVLAPTPTPCPGGVCPTTTATPTRTPSPTPFPNPCVVGAGADVCIVPPALGVSAGNGFALDIVVDDVTNLGAYSFTLGFDPAFVAPVSVVDGPFLGSTGRGVVCGSPTITATSVSLGCVTTGDVPPGPSGSGILAKANFVAVAAGTTPMTLSQVLLANISGAPIAKTTHNGSVTVFEGPVPTATITPTPTPPGPTGTPTPVTATLVWISPATQSVAAGANAVVDVRVDNVQNLGSYEWQISYDPARLSFVSVVNGPFLGSTGRSVFCPNPILDVGSVRSGCVTAGVTPAPPNGSGVLSTVTFSALAAGTSPLTFVFVSLSDPLGNDIPTGSQGGEIVVTAGGGAPAGPGASASLPSAARMWGLMVAGVGLVLLAPDVMATVGRRRRDW